jgi:hypothetical protein
VVDKAVNEVVGHFVALVNEWIVALDHFDVGVVLIELGDEGIVLPQGWTRRPHIGDELTGVARVQVSNGGREHNDIAGRLVISENEFSQDWIRLYQAHYRQPVTAVTGKLLGSTRTQTVRLCTKRGKPSAVDV